MAYLVRLDKENTHGWQARIPSGHPRKYYSKLFSDSKYGPEAKRAAYEYMTEYLQEYPELTKFSKHNLNLYPNGFEERECLRSNNTSGTTGVFRSYEYTGPKKKRKLFYWCASCSIDRHGRSGKRATKKFYIDTHGENEAKSMAIEFRKMWEEAAQKGKVAVIEFFEDYDTGLL